MKNFLYLLLIPLFLISCGKGNSSVQQEDLAIPNNPLVDKITPLFEKYPNYQRNEMAREKLLQDISLLGQSFIGTEAPFNGIKFGIKEIIENPQNGALSVLLQAGYCPTPLQEDKDPNDVFLQHLQFGVLGIMPEVEVIKLDNKKAYYVEGIVKAYDEEDSFFIEDRLFGIYIGTFILNDMNLKPVE